MALPQAFVTLPAPIRTVVWEERIPSITRVDVSAVRACVRAQLREAGWAVCVVPDTNDIAGMFLTAPVSNQDPSGTSVNEKLLPGKGIADSIKQSFVDLMRETAASKSIPTVIIAYASDVSPAPSGLSSGSDSAVIYVRPRTDSSPNHTAQTNKQPESEVVISTMELASVLSQTRTVKEILRPLVAALGVADETTLAMEQLNMDIAGQLGIGASA